MRKKPEVPKYLEVEKVRKARHCKGKKCNRFLMLRQSCTKEACFFQNDDGHEETAQETDNAVKDKDSEE